MKRFVWAVPLTLTLTLALSGCMLAPSATTEPSATPPPAAVPSAGVPTVPGTTPPAAPKTAQAKAAAEAKPLTMEEVQARRDMEKLLDETVTEYWKLVAEKNVQEALTHVIEAYREVVRNELYQFNAAYRLTGTDLLSKSMQYEGMPQADVTVALTVFEKTSVVPVRKEAVQTWRYAGGRWLVVPGK